MPGLSQKIVEYRKAIQEAPERADLYVSLGACLHEVGDLEGAVQNFQRALSLDRNSFGAYNNLGNLFASLGDFNTALTFLRAAVTINPNVAEIHNNIANILIEQGEIAPAIESYQQAIALKPENASYYNHLGNALRQAGDHRAAEENFERALALNPNFAEVYANLGFLYFEQDELQKAEDYYQRAIAIDPDLAMAHACLSQMLLRRGEFLAGWKEHEWRWLWSAFPSPRRNFQQPLWHGEEIRGSRILLHAEQGLGDALQFLRYVPMVVERGARVVLEIHPELRRLVGDFPGVEQVLSRGEQLPSFDLHCPLMSLPYAFGTTLDTVPAKVPYLKAPSTIPAWIKENPMDRLKVGLVWAGNPKNKIDHKRSVPLSSLAQLCAMEGVEFYSLQRGAGLKEIETVPFRFLAMEPASGDFTDTAAAVAALDLILTVDTSIAHLAGALGKPVWILLAKVPDWRWMLDGEDSPWYPTARLFRQEVSGEWDLVVTKVAAELMKLVSEQL